MKVLVGLTLTFFCFNSFAKSFSVIEKLTSYLPVGFYEGRNDHSEFCSVQLSEVNFPKKDIQVRVMTLNADLTKLVEENSDAGFKDYKREFVQTNKSIISSDDNQYVERILKTMTAGSKKQYVVVSWSVVNNNERQTEEASCIVDLP
jgi:hypothetical protein